MKAVVLVGGLGTRLRPYTFSVPKPLLPVGDTPLLQLIIERLAASGVDDVILATGYHAELIHAFCGDGDRFGIRIGYVHEDAPLGTAGPLALVRDRFAPGELFLVVNGDVLTKLDLRRLASFADEHRFDLTVAYTTYTYTSPYGVLDVNRNRVVGVEEKPSHIYSISAGMYAVRAEALSLVPDRVPFGFPDLVNEMLARDMAVGAFPVDEFWLGLEDVQSFDRAVEELARAQHPDPRDG